jgi:hypothetical protein
MTDVRSPLALKIINANPAAYQALVVAGDTPATAREMLQDVTAGQLLSVPVAHEEDAQAMLAGLWLWHDALDESHHISQGITSVTGSFWHAIMHRREGDFSNSKYWYARCRAHPILPTLAQHAATAINPLPADLSLLRLVNAGWNSDAFVDLVQRVHENPQHPHYPAAVHLQQIEWRVLFDYCVRSAAGK